MNGWSSDNTIENDSERMEMLAIKMFATGIYKIKFWLKNIESELGYWLRDFELDVHECACGGVCLLLTMRGFEEVRRFTVVCSCMMSYEFIFRLSRIWRSVALSPIVGVEFEVGEVVNSFETF